MRILSPLGLALAFAPLPAGALPDAVSVVEHIYEVADLDGDGAIDAAEYEAADLAVFGVDFDAMDLDGDGAIGFEEYLEVYEAHHPSAERLES